MTTRPSLTYNGFDFEMMTTTTTFGDETALTYNGGMDDDDE